MPSKREIREHLPEAYWRAACLVEAGLGKILADAEGLPAGLVAAIEEVLMRLQEKAERLDRSRGCNDRP